MADLALPGRQDGLDLLSEARVRLPHLPAVILTGHMPAGAAERLVRSEHDGPFVILRKPVSGEILRERLAGVLGGAAAGDGTGDMAAGGGTRSADAAGPRGSAAFGTE